MVVSYLRTDCGYKCSSNYNTNNQSPTKQHNTCPAQGLSFFLVLHQAAGLGGNDTEC
jgi:hypothetical protein